ncbi:MAG: RloB family protein [Natronosporangium sp.]
MPRRENVGRRRQPAGVRRRTVLIYCGGVRTEPDYFDGLRERFRRGSVTIKIRQEGIAPVALVRAAAGYRERSSSSFDDVWCVVDVDRFDLDIALAEAYRRNVRLAVSNPCFELWLLLHHADCRAFCRDCAEVERRLRKHVPGYDKAQLDFGHFAEGVGDAVKRARDLDRTGAEHRRNPSTSVWRLVERIVGE